MVSEFINASRLGALLRHRGDPASELAAEIVASLGPDDELRLAIQPAKTTATTFRIKYELAQERGAELLGLEGLVESLTALGDAPIASCVAEGPGQFAVVVLDEAVTRVEASLHVTTPGNR